MIMKRKKLRRDNMIVRRVEERRDLNILYLVTPAALLCPLATEYITRETGYNNDNDNKTKTTMKIKAKKLHCFVPLPRNI